MPNARLNKQRIKEKVQDIKESLQYLTAYSSQKDEEFLGNPEAVRAARYCFIVMAEAAINIAAHLCARLICKAPSTYAESFYLLGEHKLLDPLLAARLGKMMGFRNLLIHGYGKIDDRRMLQIMRNDLSDILEFLKAVEHILNLEEASHEGS